MNLLLLGLLLGSIAHAADDLSEIEDKLVG